MSATTALNWAHRATVTGLVGIGVWGLWLTGAVWKSRRDDRMVSAHPLPRPLITVHSLRAPSKRRTS